MSNAISSRESTQTRLAYIVGMGGSGKSTLANQFVGKAHKIDVDVLQHDTASRLTPFVKPMVAWDWKYWESMLEYCDVTLAITCTLKGKYQNQLANGMPIVAEGLVLVLKPWRTAFCDAIRNLGVEVESEQFFWLDPPAEKMLQQIRSRGRGHEQHLTLDDIVNRKHWYALKTEHLQEFRFDDYQTAHLELNQYLEQGQALSTCGKVA